jgi:hypothetical protein
MEKASSMEKIMQCSFDPRVPDAIQPLLRAYLDGLAQALPGRVTGCYLEGSLALGGFNSRLSDIDYVTILAGPATPDEVHKLRTAHQAIEASKPQWKLSGVYVQASDLGHHDDALQPHFNYHDGRLVEQRRFTLSAITWWILKNHGIALFGPPPEQLGFEVDMAYLLAGQRENMNTYWASYITRLDGRLALLTDWGVEWTVLGVLRQYYTLREHSLVSKVQAGHYALTCLPERWHPILREAIALRVEPKKSTYRSRIQRYREARGVLKYIIKEVNSTGD